ncbi:helix-turn-helix domain-containing protein [Dongia deserti]|uniref:helix-turn-helix domain-containing protein n=1 Tax=Dongia deserti TaxID=2268030 RepID=UPI000E65341D|nr:AraC family transcriptional regulator [Dongia deserti]
MKPIFEKVTVPAGASWTLFHRRLPSFPFEWHYHPEYELTFTLNSFGQRYIGDHIAPYRDGDLALVGPNLPHTWQSARPIDPAKPHTAVVMWFNQGWVEQVLRPLPEFRATCRMLDASTRGLGFSHKSAAEARSRILALLARDQTAQVIGLIDLLAMLARDADFMPLSSPAVAAKAVSESEDERIAPVLAYLHENYADPALSVATLARRVHMSLSTLHRLFHRHAHMSVTDYVVQLRIGRASALLIGSDRPIAHIADEAGYHNLANFHRQFKAMKGVTPRAFRRAYREKR